MIQPAELDLLLASISPCGLDCGRCLVNPRSPIGRLASKLREELGGFAKYAPNFSKMDPRFKSYPEFEQLLEFMGKGMCHGCRQGQPCLPFCRIPQCVRERRIHFCADCEEFPCAESGLSGELRQRWELRMRKFQELGFEDFVAWLRHSPRYP